MEGLHWERRPAHSTKTPTPEKRCGAELLLDGRSTVTLIDGRTMTTITHKCSTRDEGA